VGGSVAAQAAWHTHQSGDRKTLITSLEADAPMQVLDDKGQPVMPKPIQARLRNSDAQLVPQITSVDFSGALTLNRTGQYTLRITITDEVAKQSTQYQTAIRVTAP
jgi:hypothetical protein